MKKKTLKNRMQVIAELKGETNTHTYQWRLLIPLPITEKLSRWKISKDAMDLNSNINQFDLNDIYRIVHLTTVGYSIFSSSHGIFTKTDQVTGYKHPPAL